MINTEMIPPQTTDQTIILTFLGKPATDPKAMRSFISPAPIIRKRNRAYERTNGTAIPPKNESIPIGPKI
jgi:hypothetical protein